MSATPPDLAATFAALGDPRRLAILTRLQQRDGQSVTALCEGMNVSRQAVSRHLKMLSDAGLVSALKSGRETRYTLEPESFAAASRFLAEIGAKWDDALLRLKAHVDGAP